jgi:hypothetical protein
VGGIGGIRTKPRQHRRRARQCVLHFDANDARRQVWNGKWPDEDDCERLGFFVNGSPDFPDLHRLFTDYVWDADTGRWERKQ